MTTIDPPATRIRRVVLLGDSVFDNAKYVAPGQSVPELLAAALYIILKAEFAT